MFPVLPASILFPRSPSLLPSSLASTHSISFRLPLDQTIHSEVIFRLYKHHSLRGVKRQLMSMFICSPQRPRNARRLSFAEKVGPTQGAHGTNSRGVDSFQPENKSSLSNQVLTIMLFSSLSCPSLLIPPPPLLMNSSLTHNHPTNPWPGASPAVLDNVWVCVHVHVCACVHAYT